MIRGDSLADSGGGAACERRFRRRERRKPYERRSRRESGDDRAGYRARLRSPAVASRESCLPGVLRLLDRGGWHSESGSLPQRLVDGNARGPVRFAGTARAGLPRAARRQGAAGRSAALSKRIRTGRSGFRDRPVAASDRRVRGRRLLLGRETPRPFLEQGTFVRSRCRRVLPVALPLLKLSPRRPASEAGRGRFPGEAMSASWLRPSAGFFGMSGCAGRPGARKACRLAGRGGRAVRRRRFGYWESRTGRVL